MKTVTAFLLIIACLQNSAPAQTDALAASKMLRDLNIQIVQAQKAGDKARVYQLQTQFVAVQTRWNVQPYNASAPQGSPQNPLPNASAPQNPAVRPPQPTNQPPAHAGNLAIPVVDEEANVIALTNNERKKRGLSQLTLDTKLRSAARDHSRDMQQRGFFSHTSPIREKEHFSQRAQNHGTTANAENIATGNSTAAAVMDQWMKSTGHRQNMLNPAMKRIGVGRAGELWTMMLGE